MRLYIYMISAGCLFSLQAAALPQLDFSKWSMQIFWLIVIFAALYVALKKFALPQVSETISTRKNRIASRLEDAKRLFEEAKLSETQQNDNLISARNQAQEIRQNMQKKVADENRIALAKIHEETEEKLTKAEDDIALKLEQAQQNIHHVAAGAVCDIFMQITGKNIAEEQALKAIGNQGGKN